eukprot:g5830.t1
MSAKAKGREFHLKGLMGALASSSSTSKPWLCNICEFPNSLTESKCSACFSPRFPKWLSSITLGSVIEFFDSVGEIEDEWLPDIHLEWKQKREQAYIELKRCSAIVIQARARGRLARKFYSKRVAENRRRKEAEIAQIEKAAAKEASKVSAFIARHAAVFAVRQYKRCIQFETGGEVEDFDIFSWADSKVNEEEENRDGVGGRKVSEEKVSMHDVGDLNTMKNKECIEKEEKNMEDAEEKEKIMEEVVGKEKTEIAAVQIEVVKKNTHTSIENKNTSPIASRLKNTSNKLPQSPNVVDKDSSSLKNVSNTLQKKVEAEDDILSSSFLLRRSRAVAAIEKYNKLMSLPTEGKRKYRKWQTKKVLGIVTDILFCPERIVKVYTLPNDPPPPPPPLPLPPPVPKVDPKEILRKIMSTAAEAAIVATKSAKGANAAAVAAHAAVRIAQHKRAKLKVAELRKIAKNAASGEEKEAARQAVQQAKEEEKKLLRMRNEAAEEVGEAIAEAELYGDIDDDPFAGATPRTRARLVKEEEDKKLKERQERINAAKAKRLKRRIEERKKRVEETKRKAREKEERHRIMEESVHLKQREREAAWKRATKSKKKAAGILRKRRKKQLAAVKLAIRMQMKQALKSECIEKPIDLNQNELSKEEFKVVDEMKEDNKMNAVIDEMKEDNQSCFVIDDMKVDDMKEDNQSNAVIDDMKDSYENDLPLLLLGQSIEARYQGKALWFPAAIERVHGNSQFYDIHYKDGDVEVNVPRMFLRPIVNENVTTQEKILPNIHQPSLSKYQKNLAKRQAENERKKKAELQRNDQLRNFQIKSMKKAKTLRLKKKKASEILRAKRMAQLIAVRVAMRFEAQGYGLGTVVSKDEEYDISSVLQLNEKVESRFRGRDIWFRGTITKVNYDSNNSVPSSYNVLYDDGDEEMNVARNLIRTLMKRRDKIKKKVVEKGEKSPRTVLVSTDIKTEIQGTEKSDENQSTKHTEKERDIKKDHDEIVQNVEGDEIVQNVEGDEIVQNVDEDREKTIEKDHDGNDKESSQEYYWGDGGPNEINGGWCETDTKIRPLYRSFRFHSNIQLNGSQHQKPSKSMPWSSVNEIPGITILSIDDARTIDFRNKLLGWARCGSPYCRQIFSVKNGNRVGCSIEELKKIKDEQRIKMKSLWSELKIAKEEKEMLLTSGLQGDQTVAATAKIKNILGKIVEQKRDMLEPLLHCPFCTWRDGTDEID